MHDATNFDIRFVDTATDPWRTVGGEDGPVSHPVANDGLLLTLEQWHAVRDTWPAGLPVGVSVPNDVDIESLEADLPRIALLALNFPKWVDGRAYSQARLLRHRFRYSGEVRAQGEVLVDMMLPLARTGFSSVVLAPSQSVEHARRALRFFPGYYQGDAAGTAPRFAGAQP